MVMYHHDNREYGDAASAAAKRARDQLGGMIEKGKGRAMAVMDQINTDIPSDFVAAGPQLTWSAGDNGLQMGLGDNEFGVHKHALAQAANYAGMPTRFARELNERDTWGQELLAHNFNEIYQRSQRRHLVRTVHGEVRGVMTDKYKRIDSRPVVEAFAQEVGALGAVPIEGYALDTKIALKALMPTVYEPVENEVMAVGMVLQNSDFGNGALSLRLFMLRLWCTNFAIADECLRKVHLGGRLPEDMAFSQETIDLETAAIVSAMRDVVRGSLSGDKIKTLMAGVKAANEAKISGTKVKEFLKAHFTKADAAEVNDMFISPEIEMLPPGQTRWRLSNAISWCAGEQKDEGKRLEMQQIAAKALPRVDEGDHKIPVVFDMRQVPQDQPKEDPSPEFPDDVNGRFVGLELD